MPVAAGLDTAYRTTAYGTWLGSALGQTFLALDTLITRITVWRPPNDIDAVGTHLFVTAVDTNRTPPRPNTGVILLDGPSVFVRDSDPPGRFIEMSFVLEPPLALPRPGYYAFFLQRDGCDEGETRITANETNPYPHGIYWVTGRVITGCGLRAVAGGADYADLVFEIEFCSKAQTPARRQSWGRIKYLYR